MNKQPFYISSTGSGLSLTIGGLAVGGIIPFISFILQALKINIGMSEIEGIVTAVASAISSVMIVIGLIRKVIYKFKK